MVGFAGGLMAAIADFIGQLLGMSFPGLDITFGGLIIIALIFAFIGLYIRIGTNSGGSKE